MNIEKKTPCYFGVTEKEGVYQVSYELTNLCNLECSHCCNRSSNKSNDGMSKEEIFSLIDELAGINVPNIYLTGGEPTVYPHFREIIEYIHSKNIELILATNGYDLDPYINDIRMNVSPSVGVFVSLDGIEGTHDEFRQKEGVYQRVIHSLKLLKNNGLPTRISTVIWRKNVDQIEDLVKLARGIGAYQIHFTVLINSGRAQEGDLEINPSLYPQIIKKILELKNRYSNHSFVVTSRRNDYLDKTCEDCKAGAKIIHINAQGVISPCSWAAKSILKDHYSLQWQKGNLASCIRRINEFGELVEERKRMFGYSGCPAIAAIYHNNRLAEDPLNQLLRMPDEC